MEIGIQKEFAWITFRAQTFHLTFLSIDANVLIFTIVFLFEFLNAKCCYACLEFIISLLLLIFHISTTFL